MLWRGKIKAVLVGRGEVVIGAGKMSMVPGTLTSHCLTVICSFLPLDCLLTLQGTPLLGTFLRLIFIHPSQGPAYLSLPQGSLPWTCKFGVGSVPMGPSQGVQVVRTLPPVQETQETWFWSLGQEDPPGGGNGNPLHYSCLENPMDRWAWSLVGYGPQDHTESDTTEVT